MPSNSWQEVMGKKKYVNIGKVWNSFDKARITIKQKHNREKQSWKLMSLVNIKWRNKILTNPIQRYTEKCYD